MLAKRIIPCLDVDDGRVKKGVNFVNLVDVGLSLIHILCYTNSSSFFLRMWAIFIYYVK